MSNAAEPPLMDTQPKKRTRGRPPNPAMRQAKHDRMLNAALHLFADHGFDLVSVEQIALSAGQSKGAFYWYFEDKEDCLKKILTTKTEELQVNLKKIATAPLTGKEKLLTLSDYRNWSDDTFQRTVGLLEQMTHSTTPSVRELTLAMVAEWNRHGISTVMQLAKEAAAEAGWSKEQLGAYDFEAWCFIYISTYNGMYQILKRKESGIVPPTDRIAKMLHTLLIHPVLEKKS